MFDQGGTFVSDDGKRAAIEVLFGYACYERISSENGRATGTHVGVTDDLDVLRDFLEGKDVKLTKVKSIEQELFLPMRGNGKSH